MNNTQKPNINSNININTGGINTNFEVTNKKTTNVNNIKGDDFFDLL